MAVNILNPGESLQGYVVEKILGVGGFGVVYLVHAAADPSRRFAIKLLQPRQDHREEVIAKQAFLNEILNMATLCQQESGIVTIYNPIIHTTPAGVQLGVVMEFLQGEPLYDVIQKQGKMVHERAIPILLLVLKTLGFAHRQGIIHRDIKPENIMVLTGGVLRTGAIITHPIKILDFGLSKAFEGEVTTESTGWGSSIYMPPERIRGVGERINVTTDIYSVGVMAYVMLTGRYPFDIGGKDQFTALRIISTSTVPPVRESYEHHPTGLDPVIAKAMALDPAARYQSCEEMAEALAQFLPGSLALFRGEYTVTFPEASPAPPPPPQTVRSTPPRGAVPDQPQRAVSAPRPTPPASAALPMSAVPKKRPGWLLPTILAALVLGVAGLWFAKAYIDAKEAAKVEQKVQEEVWKKVAEEEARKKTQEEAQKKAEEDTERARTVAIQKAQEETERAKKAEQLAQLQKEKEQLETERNRRAAQAQETKEVKETEDVGTTIICKKVEESVQNIIKDKNVTKDQIKMAIPNMEKSAMQGNTDQQVALGSMYFCGVGVQKNLQSANLWLNKAKNSGHLTDEKRMGVQYMLDRLNSEKDVQVQNPKEVNEAENTDKIKICNEMLEKLKGIGITKENMRVELSNAETAAMQGDTGLQMALGVMSWCGIYIQKNPQNAKMWLNKAKNSGKLTDEERMGAQYVLDRINSESR